MRSSSFGPRTAGRQPGSTRATQNAWPTRQLTKSTPTWKSSYGSPSTPGAEAPACKMARPTSTAEGMRLS
eukprot:11683203-Alexandrium_andersonii.AAC.1